MKYRSDEQNVISSHGHHLGTPRQGTQIVIVGGWSPGPLGYLKQALSAESCPNVIEPKNMNLFMPPLPGLWCCHPFVLLVILILILMVYLSITSKVSIFGRLLLVVLALACCPMLAGVVVRTSIETSIQIIYREIIDKAIDHNNLLLIGFSWGGAVVAEMIARGMLGGQDQPSALLIAPTTSLVAKVAFQRDAATRIKERASLSLSMNSTPKVIVVHGEFDDVFCPNQDRWNRIRGVNVHILPDSHIFHRSSSQHALIELMKRQL